MKNFDATVVLLYVAEMEFESTFGNRVNNIVQVCCGINRADRLSVTIGGMCGRGGKEVIIPKRSLASA